MTPRERYQRDIGDGSMAEDAAQAAAVLHLERLYEAIISQPSSRKPPWARLLPRRFGRGAAESVRGVYLWGGVGRGKTHLMDQLHAALPPGVSRRTHFHRFMLHIHQELRALRRQPDPLPVVADRIAGQARVLCLDEFRVSDIADAMLLARLLAALFDRGVTLVTTSNIHPDDLYRDGLQRARFLAAIDLIKRHTRTVHLYGENDFRLRALERAEIYHCPLDREADRSLRESFGVLATEKVREKVLLEIENRQIPAVRCAEGIAWFEFTSICDGPRGTADYIELARCFHTVLVSNVPFLGARDDDRAARFIHLVDEFYERNVNLLVSAAGPPADLYRGHRLAARFQRTRSRLEEMQTRRYLARAHLP